MPAENLAARWDRVTIPLAATAVVKKIEGFYATPYDDNGAKPGGTWTIGYGTIRDSDNQPVTPNTSGGHRGRGCDLARAGYGRGGEGRRPNASRVLCWCARRRP